MSDPQTGRVSLDVPEDGQDLSRREFVRYHLQRADVSPETLWKNYNDDPETPSSFTRPTVRNWLDPNSETVSTDADLYDFIKSKVMELPDSAPKRERINLDDPMRGDKGKTWREALRDTFQEKGLKARSFFQLISGNKDLPEGLSEQLINKWIIDGKSKAKTADKEYVEYTLGALDKQPTIGSAKPDIMLDERVGKGLPTRRQAYLRLLKRASIASQSFFGMIEDDPKKPEGLTLSVLKGWAEDRGVKRAKADHWDFVVTKLTRLPKPMTRLDDKLGQETHRNRINSLLEQTGLSQRKFINEMEADPDNPGVTRSIFNGWLSKNDPTERADRQHLSYVYRALRGILDWHPTQPQNKRHYGPFVPEDGVDAADIIKSAQRFVTYKKRRLDEARPDDFLFGYHAKTLSKAFANGQVNGWEKYVTDTFAKSGPPKSLNHFLAAAGVYSLSGTRTPRPSGYDPEL